MVQYQLLTYAGLVFAQRHDAPPDRRHMLADAEVEALDLLKESGDLEYTADVVLFLT